MLDVDVLNVGTEVGEAPGDVVVVADDDEGRTGERYSGDVKRGTGGRGGLEIGLVPDARDAEAEVHVIGEQGLAGGSVIAGYDPVIGARDAAVAGGWRADLLHGSVEGEEGVCGGWLVGLMRSVEVLWRSNRVRSFYGRCRL